MPAIGQDGVDAISLKPGGSAVTLSPWLIRREHAVAFVRREVGRAVEQLGVAVRADFGVAEFTVVGEADDTAQLLRHGLHAVADAQRHAQLEHGMRHAHGAFFVGRGVAAGQDDALQALSQLLAHEGVVDVAGCTSE